MPDIDQPADTRAASAGPITARERIVALDSLRGFALLGILIVNIAGFNGWFYMSAEAKAALPTVGADGIVEFLQHVLITGKFYSIFSLLFGIGFAIQLSRLRSRGSDYIRRYVRRLSILLLIGLVHIFVWNGDILMLYALCGFVLLLFRQCSDRVLIAWAVPLLLLPIPYYAAMWLTDGAFDLSSSFYALAARVATSLGIPGASADAGTYALIPLLRDGGLHGWGLASLPAAIIRFGEFVFQARMLRVFALFLIGMWVGRRLLRGELLEDVALLRRIFLIGLAIGLPANIVMAALMGSGGTWPFSGIGMAISVVYVAAVVPLALAYAAGMALLLQRPSWQRPLNAFAPVGRMALTNYLSQSLICIFIFYGAGLGLMQTIGPFHWTILALIIFAVQMGLSTLWLRYFRFGPMEWLWRSLTYGEAQKFRVTH